MSRVGDIIAVLAEEPDTALTAATLAMKTKYEVKDINAALGIWVRTHADSPVTKIATGIWKWDTSKSQPISASPLPAVTVDRGGVKYGDVTCEFTVLKQNDTLAVLTRVVDDSVWIARPL